MKGKDDPIFRLPPMEVTELIVSCAETRDWGLELFGIPKVWAREKGDRAVVAVLDTGAALDHPDLKNQILDAKDFSGSKAGPSDTHGHGTHCCGVVAAEENGGGVVGVAPRAKLLVGKVLGDDGTGTVPSIVNGINWAIEKGAHVISMSFGTPKSNPSIHAAVQRANAKGVLVIAAAGNEGPGPDTVGFPGGFEECLSVAAVDRSRKIARFSSRGRRVDVSAPGVDVLSCYPPRSYARLSGTSMATPFVAGVVALLVSREKALGKVTVRSIADLRGRIKETAVDAGETGFDTAYGYGLIDPDALVPKSKVASKKVAKKPAPKKAQGLSVTLNKKDFTESGLKKLAGIRRLTIELP